MGLWDRLDRIRLDWRWLVPILLADAAGMAFGWYYYWDVGQFNPASRYYEPPAWWPLVADSPNAVLLAVLSLLGLKVLGRRSKWLDAFAFTLNVYVGLWTTALFLLYADRMGTFDWGSTNNLLFMAHMGMPLQAFLLAKRMREDRWTAVSTLVVVAALAAFIAVDYWGPLLHPAPFLHPRDGALHTVSPLLMGTAVLAWVAFAWRGTRPAPSVTARAP